MLIENPFKVLGKPIEPKKIKIVLLSPGKYPPPPIGFRIIEQSFKSFLFPVVDVLKNILKEI